MGQTKKQAITAVHIPHTCMASLTIGQWLADELIGATASQTVFAVDIATSVHYSLQVSL